MLRITVDNGLPFELVDNPGVQLENLAATRLVGPEPVATMLDKIADCPEVDGGLLFERGFGFGYRRRVDQIDLPPVFELDQGSLMDAPEPTDDDQQLWNQVRCEGRDGGAAIVRDQVSIDAEGLYDRGAATRTVHDVAELHDIARDLARVGTVDQMRWPLLKATLAGHPELVAGRLALLEGRVITLGHQWEQLPGVTPTDLIVQGWTDTIVQQSQWIVELTCVPAAPWQTGSDDEMTVIAEIETEDVEDVAGTTVTMLTLPDVPLDLNFRYRIEASLDAGYLNSADLASGDLIQASVDSPGFPQAIAQSRLRPFSYFALGSFIAGTRVHVVRESVVPPSTGTFDIVLSVLGLDVATSGAPVTIRVGNIDYLSTRLTVYRVGSSVS
jgi:hypothetical protein